MNLRFINEAARNVRVLVKKSIIVPQSMRGNRSFTECKIEKEMFCKALPKVINAIAASPELKNIPEFPNAIKEILDNNLSGFKCTIGLSTVLTYTLLEKPEKITEESLELCSILGWCMDMFQAYWLILDDITDKSVTRFGLPCWHALPEVSMRAVNDSALIYGIMLKLLKTNFENLQQYSRIMNIFNETLIYTAVGQNLDYTAKYQKQKDYTLFTSEFYETTVKYKGSYIAHISPVYLGMTFANINDAETLRKLKEIGFKMGVLNQIQNDYSDIFALESETGKLGTDIQEGKCSWLAVTALQNCNEEQRKIFTTFYGSPNAEHVKEIKTLYEQLKLPELYQQERSTRYDELTRLAQDFNSFPRAPELFLGLIEVFLGKKCAQPNAIKTHVPASALLVPIASNNDSYYQSTLKIDV